MLKEKYVLEIRVKSVVSITPRVLCVLLLLVHHTRSHCYNRERVFQ
jgi:hypothetical protein